VSHVAEVKLKVTDLDVLADACEKLGLELVRGQTTYQWYGRWLNDWSSDRAAAFQGRDPETFGKCDHAIRVQGTAPGSQYEIGLCARLDGKPGYDLVYDAFGSGQELERRAGVGLVGLQDRYAAAVAMVELRRKGYRVSEQRTAEGAIKLVAVKA
jgi:hypothetical protein